MISYTIEKILSIFLISESSPRLARGFAFVSTKAVLVRKNRQTFRAHKPKAPLCRKVGASAPQLQAIASLPPKAAGGLFYDEIFAFTIPPSCFASHLPLHKGGSLPPDSTPKRCNSPILQYVCKRTENVKFSVLLP